MWSLLMLSFGYIKKLTKLFFKILNEDALIL